MNDSFKSLWNKMFLIVGLVIPGFILVLFVGISHSEASCKKMEAMRF